MPGGCPLPNYSSVIRWTVQDVINWLGQNKLKESIPNFRLAGVDGNKLLNCTDTDLSGISCPEKEIRIIMNFIKQVDTPNRPFMSARYTKSDGYKRPSPPTQDDSGEESDGGGWDSDEFDDSEPDDYLEPEAPSRPPPIPSSQTGRIPPLQSKNQSKGRRRPPPPNPSTPECYEDPDEGNLKVSKPPQAPASVPKRPGKLKQPPPTQQDDQEVYEEPDVPAPPVNKSKDKKGKKPSPPREPDQEVYEDPDVDQPESGLAPPVPRNVPKRPFSKQPAQQEPEDYEEPDVPPPPPSRPGPPSNVPRRPAGSKPAPTPQPDEQEVYEDPDVPPQASSIPQPPRNIPKCPPGKKPPASEPFQQDVYEVPDVETPPLQKRKNENVGRAQQIKQTPKPQLEEETYEEPDAPPPRPAVTQVKDPPKKFPPPPVRNKENYTQVQIKEDKGSTRPVATVPPTATGNEVLEQQKWFYGDTNREVIRKRLEQQHVNGMYVIRNSTKSPTEPYTLQIFYDGKVYNLSIRRRPDNKYAIGAAKSDEKGFSTLLDLINFFKQNFLVLQGGSQTKLLRSLPKE